jgi:hypothetical protein
LEEGLADGSISKAPEAPAAPEEAIFELERRKMDPDFEGVRAAMRSWAITLPVTMQHQLDNNVVIFNREYDRVAARLRAPRTQAPIVLTKVEEKKVDKVIQAKERAKESGRIEAPGAATELNPDQAKEHRLRELKREMKKGGPRQDEIAAEYLLLTRFS